MEKPIRNLLKAVSWRISETLITTFVEFIFPSAYLKFAWI